MTQIFLLYIVLYNRNTTSCIKKYLLSVYKRVYNDNKYFYYTSSRITEIHLHV